MKKLIFSTLVLFLTLSTSAHAKCRWLPDLFCKTEKLDSVSADDLQSSEIAVSGVANAQKSINLFSFERLIKEPGIGYSYITYSMVDNNITQLEDNFSNAKEIVQRSVLDWVKSIFRANNKIFVVSLDVFGDEAETQLIAHKPIIVIESTDKFRDITERNDISLNGRLGFPRLSNRPHRVKLTVRFANTNDVSLDVVTDLLEAANAFSSIVPSNVGSLVDEATLIAFKEAKSKVEIILGKFQVSTTMSRALTMRHARNEIVAFNYDFRAPSETTLPRVKLSVNLKHVESILVDGGARLPGDIMSVLVHEKDDDTIALQKFIQTHDISKDDVAKLETTTPDVSTICQQIKEALAQRLTAVDQTIGLNAFVSVFQSKFMKNWSTNNTCFRPGDIKALQDNDIEPAELWKQEQPASIVELSKTEQVDLVKAMSDLLTNTIPENLREGFVNGVASHVPEDNEVVIVDEVGLVLKATFSIQAREFLNQLASREIKLDRSIGCYSGDQFDTDLQPNVMGALSMYGGKPIEILFEFSASPSSRQRPELNRLFFQRPTKDRLIAYRDGVSTRAMNGCAGQFKPWELMEGA